MKFNSVLLASIIIPILAMVGCLKLPEAFTSLALIDLEVAVIILVAFAFKASSSWACPIAAYLVGLISCLEASGLVSSTEEVFATKALAYY